MTPIVLAAALAALVGTPHCALMCGPLAGPAMDRPGRAAAFGLGKTTTYAALGAFAGVPGALLPQGSRWAAALSVVLLAWFALRLAGVRLPKVEGFPVARWAARMVARTDLGGTYTYGMLIGLVPCGLVYSALALAVAAGSPAAGALAMTVFGVLTLPALAAAGLGLARLRPAGRGARWGAAAVVFVLGVGSVWLRSAPTVAEGEAPPCHQP